MQVEYNVATKTQMAGAHQSINQSFICSEQQKKQVQCIIQCRTGHKGMLRSEVLLREITEERVKDKAFQGRKRLYHQQSIQKYKEQQKIENDAELQTEEECHKPATYQTTRRRRSICLSTPCPEKSNPLNNV